MAPLLAQWSPRMSWLAGMKDAARAKILRSSPDELLPPPVGQPRRLPLGGTFGRPVALSPSTMMRSRFPYSCGLLMPGCAGSAEVERPAAIVPAVEAVQARTGSMVA